MCVGVRVRLLAIRQPAVVKVTILYTHTVDSTVMLLQWDQTRTRTHTHHTHTYMHTHSLRIWTVGRGVTQ